MRLPLDNKVNMHDVENFVEAVNVRGMKIAAIHKNNKVILEAV